MRIKFLSVWLLVQTCFCIVFFLSLTGCDREDAKPGSGAPVTVKNELPKSVVSPVAPPSKAVVQVASSGDAIASETTLLATITEEQKPHLADTPDQPYYLIQFNDRGTGVAYVANISDRLHVVHNGKVGRALGGLDTMAISPDGLRVAYSAVVDGHWRMVIDDKEGVMSDEANNPVFSPDSRHISYTIKSGDNWYIVVDGKKGPPGLTYVGGAQFSGDSSKIIYQEHTKDELLNRLVVSDLAFREEQNLEILSTPFIINDDKTRIAAIQKSGSKQRVISFTFARPEEVMKGPLYDNINKLVFGQDNVSLSYVAEKGSNRLLILNNREEPLPDGEVGEQPVVRPDGKVAGVIISSSEGFSLHQIFLVNGAKEKNYEEAASLVYSRDSKQHAFAAKKGDSWFIVINGKEGPAFDRVVSPVFSPDGTRIVYRARKDGRRFMVIADVNGTVIAKHAPYEQVFQPVFTADGKSVAYGVQDGRKLIWKVERLSADK